MVVRGLITAASLDEYSNLGGWGIVFQGGDHQSTGQSGHLKTQKKDQHHNSYQKRNVLKLCKVKSLNLRLKVHLKLCHLVV